MSTLPKNSAYYKKFLNGDFGHAHAAQEFGVWAVLIGLVGWLLSPLIACFFVVYFMQVADKYWTNREINQALAVGRIKRNSESGDIYAYLHHAPLKPNDGWTQDAIDDVKFPRKARKLWLLFSLIYIAWLFYSMGIYGVLLQ